MAPDHDYEYEQIKEAVALATKLYDDEAALYLASLLRSMCTENQFQTLLNQLHNATGYNVRLTVY